jgi:hypothetical protein
LTNAAKVKLTLLFNCFPYVFASLALSLYFLAISMHPHSTFSACFNGVIDLIMITKTARAASLQGVLLMLTKFVLLVLEILLEFTWGGQSFQWHIIAYVSLVILCDFKVVQQVDWSFIERFPQIFLNQKRYVLIIKRIFRLNTL